VGGESGYFNRPSIGRLKDGSGKRTVGQAEKSSRNSLRGDGKRVVSRPRLKGESRSDAAGKRVVDGGLKDWKKAVDGVGKVTKLLVTN
jgi:hypothetical protein